MNPPVSPLRASPKAADRPAPPIEYPDSDGELMADNTEQFDFIQIVKANLDLVTNDFVAGDHLWYPVEGHPEIRVAPDVYVALGRPKGYRGSYLQWKEEGIPPRVVFEWWSPKNNFDAQVRKLLFYNRYGVEEFYTFDQVRRTFSAFVREGGELVPVSTEDGFTSPLLGIRFELTGEELRIFRPDGRPFQTLGEAEAERDAAAAERDAAAAERDAAAAERDAATIRAEALAEKLRSLGIDPDAP